MFPYITHSSDTFLLILNISMQFHPTDASDSRCMTPSNWCIWLTLYDSIQLMHLTDVAWLHPNYLQVLPLRSTAGVPTRGHAGHGCIVPGLGSELLPLHQHVRTSSKSRTPLPSHLLLRHLRKRHGRIGYSNEILIVSPHDAVLQ